MTFYRRFVLPFLSNFDAEKTHYVVFGLLRAVFAVPGVRALTTAYYKVSDPRLARQVAGLTFPSPVGLAAGFDKNASFLNILPAFGFGFIEVGTVTPVGQLGNSKPRLFRLLADDAILNRMGFNNDGADVVAKRLRNLKRKGYILGGNIGKNKVTSNEEANTDYRICFEKLFPHVDYFVVNVSSPNTPGLRALQDKEPLTKLLQMLQIKNTAMSSPKPIFLKIAPDLTNEQLDDIVAIVQETGIAGVIATNTTISREGLATQKEKVEKLGPGGVSGKPVRARSTDVVSYLAEKSGRSFPIIAVGGIFSGADAIEKLQAGASLVQVYSGFIYEGPGLVKRINKAILKTL